MPLNVYIVLPYRQQKCTQTPVCQTYIETSSVKYRVPILRSMHVIVKHSIEINGESVGGGGEDYVTPVQALAPPSPLAPFTNLQFKSI